MNSNLGQSWNPASAYQGNNFLSIARDLGGSRTGVELGTAYSSGTLKAQFMVYIPTNGGDGLPEENQVDLNFCGDLANEWNTRAVYFRALGGGTVTAYNNAVIDTTVPYAKDTWQEWTIETDLDNDQSRVTVRDPGTVGQTSAWYANHTGSMDSLNVATPGALAAYAIDAIPEPSTFALLIVGGLLALGVRRRRR